jgi:hypothetical protein
MKSKNPEERLIDLEFDGVVSETGTVEAPPEVASALVSLRGTKVRVRVRSRERAAALEARGLTKRYRGLPTSRRKCLRR